MGWNEENEWERNWWGNCVNTWGEESKQMLYASLMGLDWKAQDGKHTINVKDISVLDIGGGPVSKGYRR
jgi:hypothetical protein